MCKVFVYIYIYTRIIALSDTIGSDNTPFFCPAFCIKVAATAGDEDDEVDGQWEISSILHS